MLIALFAGHGKIKLELNWKFLPAGWLLYCRKAVWGEDLPLRVLRGYGSFMLHCQHLRHNTDTTVMGAINHFPTGLKPSKRGNPHLVP